MDAVLAPVVAAPSPAPFGDEHLLLFNTATYHRLNLQPGEEFVRVDVATEERPIGTLSVGQMQRGLFARLLLQDARVIVLDEPFNAIDTKTCSDLIELIRRWHGEQRTILTALHDLELVKAHFPETLLLAREPVAWGKTADVLTPDNWTKARHMCEAFDDQAQACVVEAA